MSPLLLSRGLGGLRGSREGKASTGHIWATSLALGLLSCNCGFDLLIHKACLQGLMPTVYNGSSCVICEANWSMTRPDAPKLHILCSTSIFTPLFGWRKDRKFGGTCQWPCKTPTLANAQLPSQQSSHVWSLHHRSVRLGDIWMRAPRCGKLAPPSYFLACWSLLNAMSSMWWQVLMGGVLHRLKITPQYHYKWVF